MQNFNGPWRGERCRSRRCRPGWYSRWTTQEDGTPLPDKDVPTYDVIVAGAGPVGLTLAIDLGRRGVRCLLIERSPTTLPYPKMDRSNARTMEFYRRIGIADRVRALGYPADNPMDVFLTTRLCDPPIAVLKYPSVAERRKQIAESPNGAWLLEPYQLVSQNKLEPLLKEVAEGTPNVTVRYGCELVDFTQDEHGVTVQARTVDGGEGTLRCGYLAGCDGGTSTVRKKLGIRLEGRGGIRELVQVIFRSEHLYERIVTGKGRHYQSPSGIISFPDITFGSSVGRRPSAG